LRGDATISTYLVAGFIGNGDYPMRMFETAASTALAIAAQALVVGVVLTSL
jgi:hypothetical protein